MKKLALFSFLALVGGFEIYKSFELAPNLEMVNFTTGQKRIRIMTYNVENLFDTKDDPTKNDETFLPRSQKNNEIQKKCRKSSRRHWVEECLKTNWTTFKLDLKMQRLAKVINAAKPDVLILQEIENIGILELFNKKYLGFPTVILKEGPDKRGIDVGILSKLPESSTTKLHLQKYKSRGVYKIKATRGILEAHLRLPNGENLTVFGIHFPSQGSPTKARTDSIGLLNKLRRATPGLVVAGGDFNIIERESSLYTQILSSEWRVSHLEGCKNCKGSNYYHRRRSWSFLDALLFSKTFDGTWKLDKSSIQIFNRVSVQNDRFGNPAKFEMGKNATGVSDHWPVVAEIHL